MSLENDNDIRFFSLITLGDSGVRKNKFNKKIYK